MICQPVNRELKKKKRNITKQYLKSGNVEIHLGKARSKDFYKLLNNKTHMGNHSGPDRWSKSLSLNEDDWSNIFKSLEMFAKKKNSGSFISNLYIEL